MAIVSLAQGVNGTDGFGKCRPEDATFSYSRSLCYD
jgi:hypothetical protein